MTDSSKKQALPAKTARAARADAEAIANSILEKQRDYLETRFNQLEEMGKDTDGKLCAIQNDLMTLRESIGTVNVEVGKIRGKVKDNSAQLSSHESMLDQMQLKLADMEDRSRRCNVRIIGLTEGIEGSNAVQFLTNSLPEWFPSLVDCRGEIMRAHRIYGDNNKKNRTGPRTMIFNVLRFTTCQSILRAAKKDPVTIEGRRIRFAPDYSGYTLKRRQAFSHAMDTARAKGVEFSLRYPATLRVKVGGQMESFQSSTDAEEFVNSLPSPTTPPSVGLDDDQDGATGGKD